MEEDILSRVRRVALRTMKKHAIFYIPLEDLVSAGCVGYAYALKKFKPELSANFTFYSNRMIYWNIMNHVRDTLEKGKPHLIDDKYNFALSSDDGALFKDLMDCIDIKNIINSLRLTERQKLIVELRCAGYSIYEIGEKLGISGGFVFTLLVEIKRKFKRAMRESYSFDSSTQICRSKIL